MPGNEGKNVTHCPQNHEYTKENTSTWNGHRSCRTCKREKARDKRANGGGRNEHLRRYNITEEEYLKKFEQQKGLCAICGEPEMIKSKITGVKRWLDNDHDHDTNENRDLLCHACNIVIGSAKDNIEILQRAIDYLEKWKTQ